MSEHGGHEWAKPYFCHIFASCVGLSQISKVETIRAKRPKAARMHWSTCNADMYNTEKTSLKAEREDWGGGGPLKTPAKHRENERRRDHSHPGSRGTKGTNETP